MSYARVLASHENGFGAWAATEHVSGHSFRSCTCVDWFWTRLILGTTLGVANAIPTRP